MPGHPNLLQNKKRQYLGKGLSYFVYLLHVVARLWKLVLSCRFSWVWPCMSKALWYKNRQYLWKGLRDFVDFLYVFICILLDIHWSYKNLLILAGAVRHRLSELENYMRYQVDLLLRLKLAILCYDLKMLLTNRFAGFFTFDLFDLLILIPRVPLLHCTCYRYYRTSGRGRNYPMN